MDLEPGCGESNDRCKTVHKLMGVLAHGRVHFFPVPRSGILHPETPENAGGALERTCQKNDFFWKKLCPGKLALSKVTGLQRFEQGWKLAQELYYVYSRP